MDRNTAISFVAATRHNQPHTRSDGSLLAAAWTGGEISSKSTRFVLCPHKCVKIIFWHLQKTPKGGRELEIANSQSL